MKLIKLILKTIAKIIHFRPYSEWTEEEKIEYAKRQRTFNSSNQSNETRINPATGLPMIGCLDVNGNSFGTNHSHDHFRRNNDDYCRHFSSTSYSSSYDPFTNRY
jgi:hypothetical protein